MSTPLFTLDDLDFATEVVRRHMPPTPTYHWPLLSERLGTELWVKHENHTPAGAFKVRGGFVLLDQLARSGGAPNGIISATRGNHGISLSIGGQANDIPVTIVAPVGNSVEKNASIRSYGAELILHGADFEESRQCAARLAEERGLLMIPSYHQPLVLGVATYAAEMFNAVADLDVVYVPIGMGSGICGLITVRDLLGLPTRIVGVQATGAPSYALSFEAGHVVATEAADTLADGVATRSPVPEAVELINAGADHIVLVTDEEIAAAARAYYTDAHQLVEGAGAAALAGALHERDSLRGRKVGVILSGGGIDMALYQSWVLAGADAAGG